MMQVSILMPVYNEKLYLSEAVESVARQTKDLSLEVICVDDCSTDDTWGLMVELQKKYSFLKCYKNDKKGKNNAFNYAYQKSCGAVIILLAGDDKLVEETLHLRIEPVIMANEASISLSKYKTFSKVAYLNGMVVPKKSELGSLSGGTIAFNRRFADLIFPIPPVLSNEDMWINCHVKYNSDVRIVHVPVVALLYRLHENNSLKRNVSFNEKNRMISTRSIVYSVFLEKYRCFLPDQERECLARLAALETLRANRSLISILFFKNVALLDRIRALVYASPLLHWIHMRMQKWTAGN
ncbi:glycosyltransferase [Stutzerimonas stutzeri]|uniref:Glycosyltransferase n=2 Tax=Stutzerimonas stutzeri TaxID=316 RepID=A0A6I6LI26_STUST|nr:glycosyltransferase [Stutzerimonas stutzeri]